MTVFQGWVLFRRGKAHRLYQNEDGSLTYYCGDVLYDDILPERPRVQGLDTSLCGWEMRQVADQIADDVTDPPIEVLLENMSAMADELWRMSDRMSEAGKPWSMTVTRMRQCASSMRWQVSWERNHLDREG